MSTRPTGKVSKSRTPNELKETLLAGIARAVRAESALREALTALRLGRNVHALGVLEAFEKDREERTER